MVSSIRDSPLGVDEQPLTSTLADEYGVAALHGVPLSQHQPVNSLDFVHNGFQTRDQSWMNLPADYPMAIGQEPAQESQPAESALDGWLGEEGTSSRKQG